MTATSTRTPRTATCRALLIAMMAVIVLSLQVGLPWLSCYLATSSDEVEDEANDQNQQRFWQDRFRFDRFLNPAPAGDYLPFASYVLEATVCQDEIVLLMRSYSNNRSIYRINLRTGRTTASPALQGLTSVVSDGRTLWQIPDSEWNFCLLEGRPVRFNRVNSRGFRYQLLEFEAGIWKPRLRFVLVPFSAGDATFEVDRSTGKLCCIAYSSFNDCWFRYDLPIYSEEEYTQAFRQYRERAANDTAAEQDASFIADWRQLPESDNGVIPNSLWVDRGIISELFVSDTEQMGLKWTRVLEDNHIEHQFVPLPLYKPPHGEEPPFYVVKSAEGSIYLVSQCTFDGRWTVLRWGDGNWYSVVDQRSPLLGSLCVDTALFAIASVIIPMLVLAFLAACIQRRHSLPNEFSDRAVLASIRCRGLARAIDVSSWAGPLLMAVVFHPAVVEWWSHVLTFETRWNLFQNWTIGVASDPRWNVLGNLRSTLAVIIEDLVAIPILWPLVFAAVVVFVGQSACQCVSGQTLGKWLLGIKVVRSDLRRCSWGRSCLREALFFVDTLLLLSWVPGVVSMLLTSKSQRIGDWVTDTIVIDSKCDQ